MFYFDILDIDRRYKIDCFRHLTDFDMTDEGKMFNKRIRDRIAALSDSLAASSDPSEMAETVSTSGFTGLFCFCCLVLLFDFINTIPRSEKAMASLIHGAGIKAFPKIKMRKAIIAIIGDKTS